MTSATVHPASGKVWLVTGASSGFGRAITSAAVAAGDTVIAAARRTEALADLAAAHPGRVVPTVLDVTEPERVAAVVEEAIADLGRVDVLVNNAGRGFVGAVEETTDEDLRELMELHFFGPAALIRAVLPRMRERGYGAIVQISSQGGRFSFAGVGAYSATKFALEGLSEALALEVAPHGVKVLIVEPGAFRTGFAGSRALRQSTATPAYEETVGTVRTLLPNSDGRQPGDPAKAAAAIVAALNAEQTPLRLPLGNDAVDGILTHLRANLDEIRIWESTSRSTDFEC
jgi:NAD(P)-dependent dehydrogenase (short-subunit alcohol dehydrogenase family)